MVYASWATIRFGVSKREKPGLRIVTVNLRHIRPERLRLAAADEAVIARYAAGVVSTGIQTKIEGLLRTGGYCKVRTAVDVGQVIDLAQVGALRAPE